MSLASAGRERVAPTKVASRMAREVVEDVLLEVRGLGGRVDRGGIVDSLEAALVALHQVEAGELEDHDHLDRLFAARDKCRTAGEIIGDIEFSDGAQRMSQRISAVAKSLEHAREAGIDALVERQGSKVRAELRGRTKEALPRAETFGASDGLPRLFALERDVLRASVDGTVSHARRFEHEALLAEEAESTVAGGEGDGSLESAMANLASNEPEVADEAVDPAKRLVVLADAQGGPSDLDGLMTFGLAGELVHLERMTRACFEEVSAAANIRRLEESERYSWLWMTRTEARMTAGVDALMALAQPFYLAAGNGKKSPGHDVLEAAVRYGRDALTADPGRAFARTFLLGCVAGEDTVRAAVLALKQSPPYTHRAQTHALAMAPNPAIDEALARLLSDDDRAMVVVALDALYARGRAEFGTLVPLFEHVDASVRARAVRALGVATDREVAVAWLKERVEREEDDDVLVSALEALSVLGAHEGLELARDRLLEEAEEPGSLRTDVRVRLMQLLGVAGEREDMELLRAMYGGERGEATALGFHGHVELIEVLAEPLIERVPKVMPGRDGLVEAAAALVRITGAPLDVDASRPDRYAPSTNGDAWRAWLEQNRARFEPTVRYRFGAPWSPLSPADELALEGVPVVTRRSVAMELGMLLGERPVMLHDFAVRQAKVLATQRASVVAELNGKRPRWRVGGWPDDELDSE